jgi:hypothetical protein
MNQYIKEITDNITVNSLRLVMFHAYLNNKSDFMLLFSNELIERFPVSDNDDNDRIIYDFISIISRTIVSKTCNYKLVPNGMFSSLQFAKPKKKKASLLEIYDFFHQFALGPWAI